jgi:GNAT superfamily N-acetyltransferase
MNSKAFLNYLSESYGDYISQAEVTPDQVLAQLEVVWEADEIEFIHEGNSFISFSRVDGTIEDLYVSPEDRRKGVASSLEKQVCDILKEDGHKYVVGHIELANQNKVPVAAGLQKAGYVLTSVDESRMIFIKEFK